MLQVVEMKIAPILADVRPKARMYQRDSRWYLYLYHGGKQYRRSLRSYSFSKACENKEIVLREICGMSTTPAALRDRDDYYRLRKQPDNISATWGEMLDDASKRKSSWLGTMHRRALDRSRRRGHAMDLTFDEVIEIAKRSGGRCEVTGIPFTWENETSCNTPPYSPSLDRVDSSLGYTKNNVRLVCNCVNTAMGAWGITVIYKIADAIAKNE